VSLRACIEVMSDMVDRVAIPTKVGESSLLMRRADPLIRVAGIDSDFIALRAIGMMMLSSPTTMWAGGASSLDRIPQLIADPGIDVVIVDSHKLPRPTRRSRTLPEFSTVKILVRVSACHFSQEYVRWVQSIGVHGLCEKDVDPSHLVQAVGILHRSGHFVGRTLRAVPPQPHQTSPGQLSERELEVLRLVADGLENHQLALALHISIETVRSHVKNILSKLEAHNRTHAVAAAFRVGLLK
jgi:DNA-binding NarL/FixJ family response regulator